MRRWWPFINGGVLLIWGVFLLGFLSEPSAVGRVRTFLVVAGVISIVLGLVSAGIGVWMLASRRT